MIGVVPFLLAVAAAAVYLLPLIVPKPSPPDDIALPPVPGAGPVPQSPDFVAAVRAVDAVIAYLRGTGQYGAAQVDAARVLRAAVVEGATPGPDHSARVSTMVEAMKQGTMSFNEARAAGGLPPIGSPEAPA